jgi:hypothetical protein
MNVNTDNVMPPVTEGRIDEMEAERLGRKAHRGATRRAPILDIYFWRFASQPGKDLPVLCKAWLRGWDAQNLEAQ